MITRQEKIDAIYEKIARKDLTTWCICWSLSPDIPAYMVFLFSQHEKFFLKPKREYHYFRYKDDVLNNWKRFFPVENIFFKIIWHPVMIWDVLDWIQKNINNWFDKCCDCWADMIYEDKYYCSNEECTNEEDPIDLIFLNKWDLVIENAWRDSRFINEDIFLWKNLTSPIEDQSDECVDFVYDLISK